MAGHTKEPWAADQLNWKNEPDEHNWYIIGNVYELTEDDYDEDDGGDRTYDRCATSVAIVIGNATSKQETKATAKRIVNCVNALAGLTDEQVAAIPKLIYHYTSPIDEGVICDPDPAYRHHETASALRKIFPRRPIHRCERCGETVFAGHCAFCEPDRRPS